MSQTDSETSIFSARGLGEQRATLDGLRDTQLSGSNGSGLVGQRSDDK